MPKINFRLPKIFRVLPILVSLILLVLSGCKVASPSPTTMLPSSTTPLTTSSSISPILTSTEQTAVSLTPAIPAIMLPSALINSKTVLNDTKYVVFAWNDLGMHCANPSYDTAVLLPPYNNLWVQVVKRGNPPEVITSGLTVEYRVINNTYSYGKQSYGQFWDNSVKLFGLDLVKNTGLNLVNPNIHNGLSGTMTVKTDHFEAIGIPLTPINDDGSWNPYQVGEIFVRDSSGNLVAQTKTTLPISDEINCGKCHGATPFKNILEKHDNKSGTNLVSQAPVLCAGCHGDPALGSPKTWITYLSDAVHGFHSTVSAQPACYDCHPGHVTQCSRSLAHTVTDGNCETCHGDLAQVSSTIKSGRIPWENEPKCVTCHQGVAEVDTGATLYRNATGHGGIYCTSCHSSPHAMVPTGIITDNYQALQYGGAEKTIGSCGTCHQTSRGGGEIEEYSEEHGGSNPRVPNACNICHTSIPVNTGQWPHAFQWKATQGTGSARADD